jgi:hypothetical protein
MKFRNFLLAALVLAYAPAAWALQASQVPTNIPIPWANSAGASYITAIPTLSQIGVTPGRASFTDGFPPLNFQPVGSGGIPPFGADFNGILNQLSAGLRWHQAGGPTNWSSAYSVALGGYPQGAIVQSATSVGLLWLSTADNNVSNPDAAGAGWTAVLQPHGRQSFSASGTFTVPAGVAQVKLRTYGAGGGGGYGTNAGDLGAGGGAAEYREGFFSVTPGAAIGVTIGAGGLAGTVGTPTGGTGGNTVVGSLITAAGGGGGTGCVGSGVCSPVGNAGGGGSGGTPLGGATGTLGFNGSSFLYLALGGGSYGYGFGPPRVALSGSPAAANSSYGFGMGGGGGASGGAPSAGTGGLAIFEW